MRTARFRTKGVCRHEGRRPTVQAYVSTITATHRWSAPAGHDEASETHGRASASY